MGRWEGETMEAGKRGLEPRDITFAAVGVALLSVSAWVTLPIGPVPFTLQTMALAFLLLALSPRQALVSVALYLALGGAGLPLFAGMRGGVAALFGPTGGFLVGFALAALAAWAARRALGASPARDALVCAAMIACSYGVGWAWLALSTGMSPQAAFAAACAPFIVPDVVKCAAGVALARAVRQALPAVA